MTRTTADVESETADETPVDRAVAAFRDGDLILVQDAGDREGETDIL